jgi:DNA-binding Lrp family transcriptional regulator
MSVEEIRNLVGLGGGLVKTTTKTQTDLMMSNNFAVGVDHYTEDGTLWTGATHKDADGRLMTGSVHSADSEYLYHLEDLESKFAEDSYNDYPEQASENAKVALRYAEEYGWGSCGTPVGKARANQLANKESISRDTIARMSSFERQRENSDKELGDGCGRLMWLAWGGDAGVEWAGRKLKQIDSLKLTSEFKKIGRSKSLFNIYKSSEIENATFQSVLQKKAEYFANELTADQRAVIDLLNKEENTPTTEIAKALKLTEEEVLIIIAALILAEYLKQTKTGYKPSAAALDIVTEEGAKTANIELLYSYELRTNAPKLKGVSREFCVDMVKMDKLYTYEEIQNLSNDLGTDVWETRGGWYSNPNTAAPTPQCRHIWFQNVTKLK